MDFDYTRIKPQWFHPILTIKPNKKTKVYLKDLENMAYDYYVKFMPFFKGLPDGDFKPGVIIEFSTKMQKQLGASLLFERKIRLNQKYFSKDPRLLPYTLFHEMVHIWLYDNNYDPSHTNRFYNKLNEFRQTGLPIDSNVYVHSKIKKEARYVYICPNCLNRWYTNIIYSDQMYCEFCFTKTNQKFITKCYINNNNVYSRNNLINY